MKNYSDQRGVQSQIIFDAVSGRFVQRHVAHDFETAAKANSARPPAAGILEVATRDVKVNTTALSRKSCTTVMQTVDLRRVG